MAAAKIRAEFSCSVKKVWDVVTSLEEYSWRSDIGKIEVVGEKQFVEYTKEGYATTFTITRTKPYESWEFDMENDNMSGHWTGIFSEENGKAVIEFTEEVTAKKAVMKPFVKMYLKRQQAQYVKDLEKAVR